MLPIDPPRSLLPTVTVDTKKKRYTLPGGVDISAAIPKSFSSPRDLATSKYIELKTATGGTEKFKADALFKAVISANNIPAQLPPEEANLVTKCLDLLIKNAASLSESENLKTILEAAQKYPNLFSINHIDVLMRHAIPIDDDPQEINVYSDFVVNVPKGEIDILPEDNRAVLNIIDHLIGGWAKGLESDQEGTRNKAIAALTRVAPLASNKPELFQKHIDEWVKGLDSREERTRNKAVIALTQVAHKLHEANPSLFKEHKLNNLMQIVGLVRQRVDIAEEWPAYVNSLREITKPEKLPYIIKLFSIFPKKDRAVDNLKANIELLESVDIETCRVIASFFSKLPKGIPQAILLAPLIEVLNCVQLLSSDHFCETKLALAESVLQTFNGLPDNERNVVGLQGLLELFNSSA